MRNEFSVKKVFSLSWKYLIAGIVMLLLLKVENQYFSPSPIHTFLMIISGGIIYFLILVGLKDSFLRDNSKNLINQIRRKVGKNNEKI